MIAPGRHPEAQPSPSAVDRTLTYPGPLPRQDLERLLAGTALEHKRRKQSVRGNQQRHIAVPNPYSLVRTGWTVYPLPNGFLLARPVD